MFFAQSSTLVLNKIFQPDAAQLNITKNDPFEFSANQKLGSIVFSYEAINRNSSSTKSTLKIYDLDVSEKAISEISFSIDTSEIAYKLIQHEKIIQIAQKLSITIKKLNTDSLVKKYEIFGRAIYAQENIDKRSPIIQSIFFHNAVLNTINRSKMNNENCGCTPYTGYFVSKSPFRCQEDYFINPKIVFQYLDERKDKLSENDKKAYTFFTINKNLPEISYDKAIKAIIPDFSQKVVLAYTKALKAQNARVSAPASCSSSDCLMGCGSSWGCCGNYEGCCWYWTWECWLHDYSCRSCDWWCGPACRPG